ncbi:TetR family transcriptional regulator [Pseudoclavibacter alba]|uniref:TetR/AcrR family transcriptional regulator n=1 Tax=Pseudoclavibacter albus TaxID=272241 RepID=UPI0019D0998A|nr:TetR/AcrR family transcriptional regulator [Pseudoclavibacter alba]MBN6778237.1 TetR family transcriptional regulator [Pseudoclavibacter alba]
MALERSDSVAELRRIALETLVRLGVKGMTVQAVADAAGCTKSNVLYHFGSKSGLVVAALEPALERLAGVADLVAAGAADESPKAKSLRAVELLVDTIVGHRLEAYVVLNSLAELPSEVLASLHQSSEQLALVLNEWRQDPRSTLRTHIVLGGVAFALAGPFSSTNLADDQLSEEELLVMLRPLVLELLGGGA